MIRCGVRSVPRLSSGVLRYFANNYSTEEQPKRVKVYTKTGDKGTTSLFNGERRSKTDAIFDALGHTDETNSFIGVAREFLPKNTSSEQIPLDQWLESVQSLLLDVGSAIATPSDSSSGARLRRVQFDPANVETLETWIDTMENELEPLRNFILPGGGKCASFLHVARTVCRRAERATVQIASGVPEPVPKFLNRLSDFLFVCARYAAMKEGVKDTVYQKPKVSKEHSEQSSD